MILGLRFTEDLIGGGIRGSCNIRTLTGEKFPQMSDHPHHNEIGPFSTGLLGESVD